MLRSALYKRRLFVVLLWLGACACFFAAAAPPASAQFKVWVLAKLPDTPEGMAIDSKGNVYTTLFHTGEIVMLKDDGSYDHIAWVPSKEESGKGNLIGLDFDRADNIYVAYKAHSKYDAADLMDPFHPCCRDAKVTRSGVYKVDAKTRNVTPLATRAAGWPFFFPDDVAIDSQGNVYLTSPTRGFGKFRRMARKWICGQRTRCSTGRQNPTRGSPWA
jgi:Strictosidine synthase-like, N-terminal